MGAEERSLKVVQPSTEITTAEETTELSLAQMQRELTRMDAESNGMLARSIEKCAQGEMVAIQAAKEATMAGCEVRLTVKQTIEHED